MRKNQLFLLLAVTALVGFLFYKGYKTPTASIAKSSIASKEFDFNDYLNTASQKLDSVSKVKLEAIGNNAKDTLALQRKIVLWDSAGYSFIAAHYLHDLAEIMQDERTWFAAGSKFYMLAASESDSLIATRAAIEAKHALEKVIKINANNLDAKNALAACYIEVDQDVMKGVSLLKEVVEKDSNNIQAIYTLGMLSVQSNQLEKAKERFEKLIRLQPFNAEYYFYLAEIYAKTGDTPTAIKTYEKCKTLLTDKEAKKEVDTIIKKLKNI